MAIVEDHAALRVFLRDVLTRLGWEVTGIAGTAEAGYELVTSSAPDLAVVDLHLASEGGDTLIADATVAKIAERLPAWFQGPVHDGGQVISD